jgi:DNA-binding NtrC family response regulator
VEYSKRTNQGEQVPDTKRVVFVVDDEAVIAETLATILTQAGFQASAFDRPENAIAACAEQTPHLLITDVAMPGMTGIELAIHFRKTQPGCKVLLFSGQASTADLLEKARSQGYDFDMLAKPVHPSDLLAKLRG